MSLVLLRRRSTSRIASGTYLGAQPAVIAKTFGCLTSIATVSLIQGSPRWVMTIFRSGKASATSSIEDRPLQLGGLHRSGHADVDGHDRALVAGCGVERVGQLVVDRDAGEHRADPDRLDAVLADGDAHVLGGLVAEPRVDADRGDEASRVVSLDGREPLTGLAQHRLAAADAVDVRRGDVPRHLGEHAAGDVEAIHLGDDVVHGLPALVGAVAALEPLDDRGIRSHLARQVGDVDPRVEHPRLGGGRCSRLGGFGGHGHGGSLLGLGRSSTCRGRSARASPAWRTGPRPRRRSPLRRRSGRR